HAPVTFKCTHCSEVMCSSCVHVLRRKGGQPLFLCPLCSHKCQRLGGEKKKKAFMEFLQRTAKLPWAYLAGRSKRDE
ncbi:MAG: hypothetical protein KGR98_13055, partial [Verrucomicrobia bacterium]|nr:hypothetical protein [Verrucomicrobiota bacterium]